MKNYLLKQKYFLLGSIPLTLICGLLSVMLIYAVQNIVDCIISGKIEALRIIIILLVAILIVNFVLGYFSSLLNAKISQKLHLSIKKDLFQAILNQRYQEFKQTSVGSILSIFENDIGFVEEYYFDNIFVIIRNIIVLIVTITYLLILNLPMGILLLICTMIILLLPLLLGKTIDPMSEECSSNKGKFISQLKDYCEGIDVIRAYNIEKHVLNNYDENLKILENKLFQLRKKIGLYNQTMITGNYFIIVISFSLGAILVINKNISVGELIAITQVINLIMQPIGDMSSALVEINGSLTVRRKLEKILERKGQSKHHEKEYLEDNFYGIECRNVSYIREDSSLALHKITLKLEPKKKYIIVGPSGCGKTTLLKVLADMLYVSSGYISINGMNYTENEKLVKNMISLVQQDIFIFNDTVENNIQLYHKYEKESFNNAIFVTGLKENLKDRIQSECSESGDNLSGGEKQRIAIARAILRDSPVLLLDEVTSALDRPTAKVILNNIFAMEDKTVVFVTHKIEEDFLKKADCIICMNEGTIIESGTWSELINKNSCFSKMYIEEEE